MILECRVRPLGFGYSTQVWPKTRHHIVRLGTREARVIVPNELSPSFVGVLTLMAAGLFISKP